MHYVNIYYVVEFEDTLKIWLAKQFRFLSDYLASRVADSIAAGLQTHLTAAFRQMQVLTGKTLYVHVNGCTATTEGLKTGYGTEEYVGGQTRVREHVTRPGTLTIGAVLTIAFNVFNPRQVAQAQTAGVAGLVSDLVGLVYSMKPDVESEIAQEMSRVLKERLTVEIRRGLENAGFPVSEVEVKTAWNAADITGRRWVERFLT